MDGKRTTLKIRLDWSEMDMFGHINNVSFVKYMQAARVNFWQETGISDNYEKTGHGIMVAQIQCKYLKPLSFPGDIIVNTHVSSIGTTSFVLKHEIMNEEGELTAEGEDVLVFFDFQLNKKTVIPEIILPNLRST